MYPTTTSNDVLLQDQKPHITPQEYRKMQDACLKVYEQKKRKGLRALYIRDRDFLLMELMWVTGARVTDVLNFKVNDIDTYEKKINFYVHKRNHYHKISLEADVIVHIQNYITKWKIKKYLFGNKPDGEPMTRGYAHNLIQRYGKVAGISKKVYPHLFRHGCAVRLVEAGVAIEVVSYYLDHSTTSTTKNFYARITADVAQRVISERLPSML